MLFLDDIPDDQALMLQKIGEVAFRWNDLEAITRLFLYTLVPGGDRTDCVISQLGNIALTESIGAIAKFLDDPALESHIEHYLKAFDIARTYRNHFIHGPRLMGYKESGEVVGICQNTIAKGGSLRIKSADVTTPEIDEFARHLYSLRQYLSVIQTCFLPQEIVGPQDLSSLQKPTLLPQLSLHQLSVAELRRQN